MNDAEHGRPCTQEDMTIENSDDDAADEPSVETGVAPVFMYFSIR